MSNFSDLQARCASLGGYHTEHPFPDFTVVVIAIPGKKQHFVGHGVDAEAAYRMALSQFRLMFI